MGSGISQKMLVMHRFEIGVGEGEGYRRSLSGGVGVRNHQVWVSATRKLPVKRHCALNLMMRLRKNRHNRQPIAANRAGGRLGRPPCHS